MWVERHSLINEDAAIEFNTLNNQRGGQFCNFQYNETYAPGMGAHGIC